jgi:hypothetical protein
MTGPGIRPVWRQCATRSGSHDWSGFVAGGFDEGGGVGDPGDDFFGEGVVDGLAEGGADALAGGRSGGADASYAVAHAWFGACLGGTDFGVAVGDRGEHGSDVAGLELVQADVAEVRDEVDSYVAGVAALGVRVDVQCGEPAGEVVGHGGELGQGRVGAQPCPDGLHVG